MTLLPRTPPLRSRLFPLSRCVSGVFLTAIRAENHLVIRVVRVQVPVRAPCKRVFVLVCDNQKQIKPFDRYTLCTPPKRVASLRDPSRHCARATTASFEDVSQPLRAVGNTVRLDRPVI